MDAGWYYDKDGFLHSSQLEHWQREYNNKELPRGESCPGPWVLWENKKSFVIGKHILDRIPISSGDDQKKLVGALMILLKKLSRPTPSKR